MAQRSDALQTRDRYKLRVWDDPGSAVHRHSASKTHVNALMALHRIRETRLILARTQEVPMPAEPTDHRNAEDTAPGTVVVRETRRGQFQQEIISGAHRLIADEPVNVGGLDSGPGPYDLLLAALGACTSMTLRLYADRKKLPLTRTQVRLRHNRIYATDCAECETKEGMLDRIERIITLEGDLDAEQRARLMEIADKCPVHRTLKS